jgi:xanthine phosphoribosyltransferase
MIAKRKIDWAEFQGLIGKICRDITVSGWKPDYVVGLTRGGLLPAVMISHYFDIPCETLKVSLRDGGECESNCWMAEDAFGHTGETIYYDGDPDRVRKPKKILIVDDINDTGATINWILNDWQSSCLSKDPQWSKVWNNTVKFATLFDNLASNSEIAVDYVGETINKAEEDVWIDFPFEDWWTK